MSREEVQDSNVTGIRWIPVRNLAAIVAPAQCLLAVVGVDTDGTLQVNQPSTNSQTGLLVNGYVAMEPGDQGLAHNDFPCAVVFDQVGWDPAVSDQCGSEANDWFAHKGQTGYRATGGDQGNGLVAIQPDMTFAAIGAPDAKHVYPGRGLVSNAFGGSPQWMGNGTKYFDAIAFYANGLNTTDDIPTAVNTVLLTSDAKGWTDAGIHVIKVGSVTGSGSIRGSYIACENQIVWLGQNYDSGASTNYAIASFVSGTLTFFSGTFPTVGRLDINWPSSGVLNFKLGTSITDTASYWCNSYQGASGSDSIGNVVHGGIITTLSAVAGMTGNIGG